MYPYTAPYVAVTCLIKFLIKLVRCSLNHFTAAELLTGPNKFGCDTCTERANAADENSPIEGEEDEEEEEQEDDDDNDEEVTTKDSTPPKPSPSKTVYCNASKQLLIHTPPAVLTLHLKRFQVIATILDRGNESKWNELSKRQSRIICKTTFTLRSIFVFLQQCGSSLRKINKHVEFPLLLDMAPFCSSSCQTIQAGQEKVMYSLYGVVEHSGRMSGGHYVAFVKVSSCRVKSKWFSYPGLK